MLNAKKILVTGGAGFLGVQVCRELEAFSPAEILVPRSAHHDLREPEVVRELFAEHRPQVVIHLAAVVGGIGANRKNPGKYFYDNATMAIHLLEEARRIGVEKFVSVATICAYPKYTPVPFKEDDLWSGYPEETNAPYGLAKKMLLVQGQAYRQQYNFNAITLFPVNLYGPGDNFDPETSHVIPALIRKFLDAVDSGRETVEVWGTGSASREFLFVRDAARGIAQAAASYDKPDPVNLGSGQEISIRDLALLIGELCGYRGEIIWDTTKPDGQPRRCLDVSRAKQEFGYEASTSLRDGLIETIAWYEKERAFGGDDTARAPTRISALTTQLTPVRKPRRALVTGIAGQDGSYLSEFLLEKGYEVHGIVRRNSTISRSRLDDIASTRDLPRPKLHYGDVTDAASIMRLVMDIEPDEIYNLAAQSHVRISFDKPAYTVEVAAMGALNLLEAARLLNERRSVRFYQASTSEMFGGALDTAPQSEKTPFHPRSPYGCAKLYAHAQTVNYREAYGMFACCGLLFNHESPRRGENFVTRKVTRSAARIREGLQRTVALGNLDARRDWGYARDYVEAMWLMLQQNEPDDYVIATGETHTIRDLLDVAFAHVGLNWADHVEIDPRFYRPSEVDLLLGDPTKAREKLGWVPRTSFEELIRLMVDHDLNLAQQDRRINELLAQA